MLKNHILPLAWFRRSFSGRTAQFAEAATLSIVLRLLALVSPFAMQAIIDRILPYQRAESLAIILVLLLAVAAFEGLLGFTTGRLGVWIGMGIGRDLALRALHHIVHLPLATLQKWPVGQILARISEIDKVQSFIAYTTSGLLLDAGFSLVYAAVLFTISPFLTAILLLAIPLQFALYFIFGPLERSRFDKALAVVERIIKATGRLDVLVNNAGTNVTARTFAVLTPDNLDYVLQANLNGAYYCVLAVLPQMRAQQDGVLIHTASWAGKYVTPLSGTAYTASKHAVVAMSHSLNMEEFKNGIRSSVICPHEISTPILNTRPVKVTDEERARMLQSEDMANLYVYIATQPAHVCINEVTIAPTWNRAYLHGI